MVLLMSPLHVARSGPAAGPAVLLVHGLFADHSNWWQLTAVLEARGCPVVAPDLAGHGASPRRSTYSPQAWAGDVVDALAGERFDLAIGHSLGGLVLALAAPQLDVGRAVYLDPTWRMTAEQHDRFAALWREQLGWTPEQWRAGYPTWHANDVASRLRSVATMDPAAIDGLAPGGGHDLAPDRAAVPSLVVAADGSEFVGEAEQARLAEAGFDVTATPGVGHGAFREDFGTFLAVLDAWSARAPSGSSAG